MSFKTTKKNKLRKLRKQLRHTEFEIDHALKRCELEDHILKWFEYVHGSPVNAAAVDAAWDNYRSLLRQRTKLRIKIWDLRDTKRTELPLTWECFYTQPSFAA